MTRSASLPALPAELLLKVAESGETSEERFHLFKTLREVCREINCKIVYFFGSRYWSTLSVLLDEEELNAMLGFSRGDMGLQVKILELHASDILDHGKALDYAVVNPNIMNLFLDGSASRRLTDALAGFTNLKELLICLPDDNNDLDPTSSAISGQQWTMMLGSLLTTALRDGPLFEVIACEQGQDLGLSLQTHLNVLDVFSRFMDSLVSLKKFQISLSAAGYKRFFDHYSTILAEIVRTANGLNSLHISFCFSKEAPPFFRQIANKVEPNMLRKLELQHLEATINDLTTLLESFHHTLRSLTLDCITLSDHFDNHSLFDYLIAKLQLQELYLRCLTQGGHGLDLGGLTVCRPRSHFEDTDDAPEFVWVEKDPSPSHMIYLSTERGDDIPFWLSEIKVQKYRMMDPYEPYEDADMSHRWSWTDF